MAYSGRISGRQRTMSAGAALIAVVGVGLGLVSGLDLAPVRKTSEAISALTLPAPQPPEPPVTPAALTPERPAGAASAANLHASAAAVVAPKPKFIPPDPPPVAAAPTPGDGSAASAGAASVSGPGSGAGGRGDGTGAGGAGSGTGGGTRPSWRSGRIEDRDYPKSASRAKVGGEVEVRFTILPTGRVVDCRTSKSSGDTALDTITCRLIEDRFRFKPATDAAGEPISSPYGWRQSWWLERRR